MATTRDEIMRKFGPKLFEAFVIMSVAETNRVRQRIGMPQITKQQFLDELNSNLETIPPYRWMTEVVP